MRLYFWLGIAVLGFLLYLAPSFMVNHMYESFATSTTVPTNEPPTINAVAPQPTPVSENVIAEMERLLNTTALESPTAPTPAIEANGARQAPAEHTTMRSTPGNPRDTPVPSAALAQGEVFSAPPPAAPQQREVVVIRAPAPTCPNCPDMRDYIRKDSIPCWGCALKR
jgi:hypothetical protein